MVVFTDGLPDSSEYRRFRIRTVAGQDDYAMLAEVVARRLKAAAAGAAKFLPLPDLIVVDGGKGQVSAVGKVLDDGTAGESIALAGLAKREEQVFIPGRGEPLEMSAHPRAQLLLQRIRDQAHRFAIAYHRGLRGKALTTSVLDEIQGIGPKRRAALLKTFPSVQAMRNASVEQLAAVPGMNRNVAATLRDYLLQHPNE